MLFSKQNQSSTIEHVKKEYLRKRVSRGPLSINRRIWHGTSKVGRPDVLQCRKSTEKKEGKKTDRFCLVDDQYCPGYREGAEGKKIKEKKVKKGEESQGKIKAYSSEKKSASKKEQPGLAKHACGGKGRRSPGRIFDPGNASALRGERGVQVLGGDK